MSSIREMICIGLSKADIDKLQNGETLTKRAWIDKFENGDVEETCVEIRPSESGSKDVRPFPSRKKS